MQKIFYIAIIVSFLSSGMYAQTQEVNVEANMDNSIFSEGGLSSGAGVFLFTGVNNKSFKRRALVKFDVQSMVPDGITVDSAMLVLVPSKVNTDGTEVTLHRASVAWGEGSSVGDGRGEGQGGTATEGDATWSHAMVGGDSWIKEGGDYRGATSATASVTLGSDAVFKSSTLTEDINAWLVTPDDNHGWIVIGEETGTKTTIRFHSREAQEEESRPSLKLYYTEGTTSTLLAETENNEIRVYQGYGLGELLVGANTSIGKSRFEVYTITGALVYSEDIDMAQGVTRIETDINETGIFVYRIISEGSMKSGKFLIRDK